jgi:hypothetical protein
MSMLLKHQEYGTTLRRSHDTVITRYLVQLPLQALSEHVGAGRAFTIDQGPRFSPAVSSGNAGIIGQNTSAGKR